MQQYTPHIYGVIKTAIGFDYVWRNVCGNAFLLNANSRGGAKDYMSRYVNLYASYIDT